VLTACLVVLIGMLALRFNLITFLLLCFVISAFFINYPAKIRRWMQPRIKSTTPPTSSYLRLSKESPKCDFVSFIYPYFIAGEGVAHLPAIPYCDEFRDVRTLYENFMYKTQTFNKSLFLVEG
jgi:hypothetical protein